MQRLLECCDNNLVLLDLPASMLNDAVAFMVQQIAEQDVFDASLVPEILAKLEQQQRTANSAIGHSLAVPHAYHEEIKKPVVAIGRLKHGINVGAPDGQAVRFVFLLLGPPSATSDHLDTLAQIARLMADDEFRYLITIAKSSSEFRKAIETRMGGEPAIHKHAKVGEGLRHSGRLFGGIVNDIKRRGKHYVSDYMDGLHPKCVSSTLFLFFACLAPAIIFGGLMYSKTGGNIGAVEMIVATAFCGLVFAIFAGQPLTILGGTGPMLIFTGILYQYCDKNSIDFLPVYAWVGIWTGVFLLLLAVTDASCLMRYFTRFTDEIFAALISLIFIYEAVEKLIHLFHRAEANEAIGYDIALLSLVLALGTFYIAYSLSAFRKSHFLFPGMREFLADFGPTIAIFAMALVAYLSRDMVAVDALDVPAEFATSNGRPWFVRFYEAPSWAIWLSTIPALLCTVLVYLDQNITSRLVNSPDNNLDKGESYHLDLTVVGILIAICSLFGLPWLVAATVRSLNHVRSLATTEEVVDRSGKAHTHILHVRENRVTAVSIHLLIALSLLLLPFAKYIPIAVLYGLFLYMGIVSMRGNQFFERLSLWATDPQLYPTTHFVRRAPRWTMHIFTLIQLICLIVLWAVKTSAIGILFPLFIAILVPIRLVMNRFFDRRHLEILDAEENPEEEEETWS